eukprot:5894030-Amphidinium_carterae.1
MPQATMSVKTSPPAGYPGEFDAGRTDSQLLCPIVNLVAENVDKRFERLTILEDQVAKLSAHIVHSDANTQQVGQQVANLATSVEQRQLALHSEMKDITNTLESHRSHTDQ